MSGNSKKGGSVGLFVTCLVNTMRPRVGFAALKLLEDAGFDVSVPPTQTCCGQPNYNAGDRAAAGDFARLFARQFESFDYVVAPSGSCAAMARVHHPRLFDEDDPDRELVEAVAARTYELTSFLTDVAGLSAVDADTALSVTYHDACSGLRELKVKQQPRSLLSAAGAEVKEMEDAEVCCGFGGLFCVKYPDISGEMVRKKSDEVVKTNADAFVTGDVGCLLNIEGALARRGEPTRAYHVAEVLAGMTDEDHR
jgi:L-lactate dehydrogenase complex protein LldE